MTLSGSTDLTPETSDIASLRQAVEWVAFGLVPLPSPYDEVFRQEGNIRLMYCREDSPKIQPICEAQGKLFVALRKGLLPATACAIKEIKQANYDKDIPDFRYIKNISERQEIDCTLWEYDRIFWTDSCLAYDHPDGFENDSWLLADFIWVDAARLYELFPPRDGDKGLDRVPKGNKAEENFSLRPDETQHQQAEKVEISNDLIKVQEATMSDVLTPFLPNNSKPDEEWEDFHKITSEEFHRRINEPLWVMTDALLYLHGYKTNRHEEDKFRFLRFKPTVEKARIYILDAVKIKQLELYDYHEEVITNPNTEDFEKRRDSAFYASKVKPRDFVEWAKTMPIEFPMLNVVGKENPKPLSDRERSSLLKMTTDVSAKAETITITPPDKITSPQKGPIKTFTRPSEEEIKTAIEAVKQSYTGQKLNRDTFHVALNNSLLPSEKHLPCRDSKKNGDKGSYTFFKELPAELRGEVGVRGPSGKEKIG